MFLDGQQAGSPWDGTTIELLYFVIQNGIGTLAEGVYTNDYFRFGRIHQNAPAAGYYQTINSPNTYRRIFANGDFGVPSVGAYSFGYLNDQGSINTDYTNTTPQVAIDDSLLYTYSEGISFGFTGSGFFGFKYSNGSIDTAYDSATYDKRDDVDGYSVYTDGVADRTSSSIYTDTGYYKNDDTNLSYSYLAAGDDQMHLSDSGSWKVYGTTPGSVSTPAEGALLPLEYQVDLTPVVVSGYTIGSYKKVIDSSGGVTDAGTPDYAPNETYVGTDNTYNYYSDGAGGIYSCEVAGNVVNSGSYEAQIGTDTYTIGTWEETSNGSCGTTTTDTWNYEEGDLLVASTDPGNMPDYYASRSSPYYYSQ
jgi:hypothetical protein